MTATVKHWKTYTNGLSSQSFWRPHLSCSSLINIISKMSATKSDDASVKGPGDATTSRSKDGREIVPPSLSTTALSTPTAANSPGTFTGTSEISLRRQALECLVSVL